MLRRPVALVAALAVVGSALTGCSRGVDVPGPSPEPTVAKTRTDPLVANTLTLADSFDPPRLTDRYSLRIASLLTRGLYRYDAKGKAVLEVASAVDTTDDRVFDVTLNPGWTFEGGEPVTAWSFVDAWSRAADPALQMERRDLFSPILGFRKTTASPVASPSSDTGSSRPSGGGTSPGGAPTPAPTRGGASATPASSAAPSGTPSPVPAQGRSPQLAGLTVLSPLRFRITLTHAVPEFTERLAQPAFAPLPDMAFTQPRRYHRHPVSNGPYVLRGDWSAAGPVRLRSNPAYTAPDAARNPGIDFRRYDDPSQALADVRAGRLDILDALPAGQLADYRSEFGPRAVDQPVGQTLDLMMPRTGPWTGAAGRARRQALSMALDRESYAKEIMAGTHTPATDLATPVVEGHSQDMCGSVCTHDPQAAAATLAHAGGAPAVSIAFAADTSDGLLAAAMCTDVRSALSIGCSTKRYPTEKGLLQAVSSGKENGHYLVRHQMDMPLLSSFLSPRFVSGYPADASGFSMPAVDAELDRASAIGDRGQRVARYQHAESMILAELPVIPVLDAHATAVSSTGIEALRLDVFGAPVFATLKRPTTP